MKVDEKTLRKWIAVAQVDRLTAPQKAAISEMEADRKARLTARQKALLEAAQRERLAGTKDSPLISSQTISDLRVGLLEVMESELCQPMLQNLIRTLLRTLGEPDAEGFSNSFRLGTKGHSPSRPRSLLSEAQALITRHADASERREERPRIALPRTWGPEQLAEARKSRNFVKQLEELVSRKPMKSSFREAVEEIARKGRRRP